VICDNYSGTGIGWWQMRTRIMNQLQAVAMNEGYRWKKKLFSENVAKQLAIFAVG
jgi:phage major head subunit gpT-like protein